MNTNTKSIVYKIIILVVLVLILAGIYAVTNKNESQKVESITEDSETIGDFNGYYTTYDKYSDWDEATSTCPALVVFSGNKELIKYFSDMVDIGNSVNRKDVNGNLVINLDTTILDPKTLSLLQNSFKDNPITITLQKKIQKGVDAPTCYSFFKIVRIGNSIISQISDWKTYTNKKYGFNFMYPSTWKLYAVEESPIQSQKRVSFAFKTLSTDTILFSIVIGANGDYKVTNPTPYQIPRESIETYQILLSTIKFTSSSPLPTCANGATNPPHCNSDAPMPVPVITSVTPTSVQIGSVLEIKGQNLAGFEGDLDAWIENSKGEVGFLPGIGSVPRTDHTVRVLIEAIVCETNNGYSGKPCDKLLNLTPGIYKIYSAPFGVKSNIVQITLLPHRECPSGTHWWEMTSNCKLDQSTITN